MNRTVLLYIIVPVILAVIIFGAQRILNPTHAYTRTFTSDVVQGILVGAALSFITVLLVLPNFYVTKVNGWTTIRGCGEPGSGILLRAACNVVFMGPINVNAEAMYWTTNKDGAGHSLSGAHDYILHFPLGGLPPNSAFWSLTMGDAQNRFVPNPINRYSVGDRAPSEEVLRSADRTDDRSGLIPNADGSVDIYIQNTAPTGHESNWLPAPTGNFILWLRVYLPGPALLDGEYQVPPIVQVS